jgi:hypothetical protein
MAVNFIPAPYAAGGVAPNAPGLAGAPAGLTAASPLGGLLGSLSGAQGSADPGMAKLAQALLAKRMKPPMPGSMAGPPAQIDPNGVGGMQGPVPLPVTPQQ